MAKKTTAKSKGVAVAAPATESKSVNIRKIENGWLIEENSYGKEYKSTTKYSAKKPKVSFD